LYSNKFPCLEIEDKQGEIIKVNTHYHHGTQELQKPVEFLDMHCAELIEVVPHDEVIFYCLDNKILLERLRLFLEAGLSRRV